MDNTELHYLTYDPEEIWKTMMLNYVEAGGDILYPGDEKEIQLRSVQTDIVQVFAAVDHALRMQTLRYAQGEYLDILGESRGCARIEAKAAKAKVTITANATGKKETLEAGTAMTADGQVFYTLSDSLPLTGYNQIVTVEVIADRTGGAGNGLEKGTEMVLAITHPAIKSIVVLETAKGGTEREEDSAYRERIREFGLASITTGPKQQYESVAKSVSDQIIDACALNIGAGKVGVYIILSDEEKKEIILKEVLDALSEKDIRPLTDEVSVYQAIDINYTLNIQYICDEGNVAAAAISEAVENYKFWQDNVIGRPFNPDRLIATLYQAGASRVILGDDSTFNGTNNITYTEINENERCKGEINLSTLQRRGGEMIVSD